MPPRCIKCLSALIPNATVCSKCGWPVPAQSALTQQKNLEKTQFVQLPPSDLLSEAKESSSPAAVPASPAAASPISRLSLALALLLGLLAGALLLLLMAGFTHARH